MRTKGNIENICALTPLQEGMLFHALLDGTSAAYFNQSSYRLKGSLDPALVAQSLNELFRRHDMLRTAFVHENVAAPLQVVVRNRQADFYFEDIRGRPGQAGFIEAFRRQDIARSFHLTKDVLMRVSLLRLDEAEYELIWSNHHILMDAWCAGTLTGEFYVVYHALAAGKTPVLPPAGSFSGYVKWLEKQDKQRAGAFWQEYLREYAGESTLPGKGVGAPGAGYAVRTARFCLDEALTGALVRTAGRHGVTLNSLLHTLWGVLLARYNHRNDVVFGAVVSDRPAELPDAETTIGLFINTVPVRVQFGEDTRFSELLALTHEKALSAAPYQYFSLAEMQAAGNGDSPLFDHIFTLQNLPAAGGGAPSAAPAGGVAVVAARAFEQTNYDFQVIASVGDTLGLFFQYNGAVFAEAAVEAVFGHFLTAARQVTGPQDLPVARIGILAAGEQERLLDAFTGPAMAFDPGRTVVHCLEAHARATPDAVAVVCNGASLDYRGLNVAANRLARYLSRRAAVRAEEPVVLLMDRSERMMAAILAVWKCNAAYLPLDPAYPPAYLAAVLRDSGATRLVTETGRIDPAFAASLAGTVDVIYLDACTEAIGREDSTDPGTPVPPGSLAYLIYTSGSTGAPKGVMIEHGGMMNHLLAKVAEAGVTAGSVIVQNASPCFDISVWQFFTALVAGGRTVVYDNARVLDPGAFLAALAPDGITLLEVVPSYLALLLDTCRANGITRLPPALTMVFVTGEALRKPLVARWFGTFPGIRLVNAYGPTEASDDITHHVLGEVPAGEDIPVGKPLPNFRIYVVDRQMRLCPVGVKGEIWVAGAGVGRGYLNNPEKTAAAFAPDPFGPAAGGRLYKTGDVGRYAPGGVIEFFGRQDHQLKVRGYRVEPGFIENTLAGLPGVAAAAVIARGDGNGGHALYAFVVPAPGAAFHPHETALALEKALPAYLVPAALLPLAALPLTANGKVDRAALANRVPADDPQGAAYRAPREGLEERLAALWREVLEKDVVGARDNFFRLGGHSLKAIRLASRLQKELGVKLEIKTLFAHPTVEALARVLAHTAPAAAPPMAPAAEGAHYDLSHGQKGLWLKKTFGKSYPVFNMIHYEVFDELDPETITRAYRALIARHESLRMTFVTVDGAPRLKLHPPDAAGPGVPFHDLRNHPRKYAEAHRLMAERMARRFDWESGPLLELQALRLEDARYFLVLVIDHVISDGWSVGVIARELRTHYEAGRRGEADPLPALAVQFKDYVAAEQAMIHGERGRAHRAYWRYKLAGSLPAPPLFPQGDSLAAKPGAIADYRTLLAGEAGQYFKALTPRQAEDLYGNLFSARPLEGASYRTAFPDARCGPLKAMAARLEVSLFALLTASVSLLVYRLTGRTDVLIGTPVSVREHEPVDHLIGWFLNTLLVRTHLDPGGPVADLVRGVSRETAEALAHRAYPFERLLDELGLSMDVVGTVFVHVINFEHTGTRPITDFSTAHRPTGTPTFDLNFTFHEYSNGMVLICDYKPELFPPEAITFLMDQYTAVLHELADDPGPTAIKHLPHLQPLPHGSVPPPGGLPAPAAPDLTTTPIYASA